MGEDPRVVLPEEYLPGFFKKIKLVPAMNRASILSSRRSRMLSDNAKICSACLQRQGASVSDSKKYGVYSFSCTICGGAISRLDQVSSRAILKLSEFEFNTFLVGASMPQTILDKEDEIRSTYKIRGREGIKTMITRTIAKMIQLKLGKKIDYSRPDVTLVVSLLDDSISATPRSIWVSASYLKGERGMPQRSFVCEVCNGVGCAKCNYKGSGKESVESVLTSFFRQIFRADGCNFIWIGSEDSQSLVGGKGRPFFVEILGPKKRWPKFIASGSGKRTSRTSELGAISLLKMEILPSRPKSIPQFRMRCVVFLLESPSDTEGQELKTEEIEAFNEITVQVRLSGKYRTANRKIHSVKVRRDYLSHPLALEISCEGGIPIRKLISGEGNAVLPNLASAIRGYSIDPNQPFDIVDIELVLSSKENSRPRRGRMRADNRKSSQEPPGSMAGAEMILEN